MAHTNLVPPVNKKPRAQALTPGNPGLWFMIRDQFSISTWLCVGATLQIFAWLFVSRSLALYAPVLLLAFRFVDTMLMTFGLTRNRQMDGIILKKFSAQLPDEDGKFSDNVADQPVTVILLGARSNHPLGMLGPGAKELGIYFDGMLKYLEKEGEQYGYLGASSWTASAQRTRSNEIMTVLYFRTNEGLHSFAHSESHREGWDWWNKTYKQHPHIGIMHEVYEVPKGHWENIYVNYHPTGIAATTTRRKASKEDQADGDVWVSPIMDASRGRLRTNAGRMGRTQGDDNKKYGTDPYEAV